MIAHLYYYMSVQDDDGMCCVSYVHCSSATFTFPLALSLACKFFCSHFLLIQCKIIDHTAQSLDNCYTQPFTHTNTHMHRAYFS